MTFPFAQSLESNMHNPLSHMDQLDLSILIDQCELLKNVGFTDIAFKDGVFSNEYEINELIPHCYNLLKHMGKTKR